MTLTFHAFNRKDKTTCTAWLLIALTYLSVMNAMQFFALTDTDSLKTACWHGCSQNRY